ncbi:MAG: TetR/AcrR family transcriptional regulator [Acidimicrobiales bacterium]
MGATKPREVGEVSRTGRPRSEKTRLAILEAAADLLEEGGLSELSIEAIAARAGVSKVTIYKWWPSRGSVAIDAFFHRHRQTLVLPDTGDIGEDLTTQILAVVRAFRGRTGEIMAELIGHAQFDPALAVSLRTRWLQPRRDVTSVIIQRGIDRGEVCSDVSIPVVMDQLYGPVYYRLVARHEPLSDEFCYELVRNTLRGIRTAPASAE